MEIVMFVCLMIVPVISVIALVVAIANNRKYSALKKLVLELSQISNSQLSPQEQAVNRFFVEGM